MDSEEKILDQNANIKPKTKNTNTGKIITWVIVILLFAGGLYGMYFWQHKKVDSQAKEISNIKSQLSDASKQLASSQSATSEDVTQEKLTTDQLASNAAESYCEAALNPTTKKSLVFTQGKAGPQQKSILYSSDKSFAYINARCDDGTPVEGGGSAAYYLKSVNGNWLVLYRGQESDSKLDASYGVPATFN